MKDYYQILKISRQASESEIKKSFRSLASQYHPDKNRLLDTKEIFQEINEAYQVLGNSRKKAQYDSLLSYKVAYVERKSRESQKRYWPDNSYRKPREYRYRYYSGEKKLIKKYLPHAKVVSAITFFLSILVLADFFLPERKQKDVILEKEYYPSYRSSRVDTYSGVYIVNGAVGIPRGTEINIFTSFVFNQFLGIKDVDQLYLKYNSYYGEYRFFLIFLPIILLITSFAGTLFRLQEIDILNLGIFNLIVGTINYFTFV